MIFFVMLLMFLMFAVMAFILLLFLCLFFNKSSHLGNAKLCSENVLVENGVVEVNAVDFHSSHECFQTRELL